MKNCNKIFLIVVFMLALCSTALAQEDTKGCTDHPFLMRMPQYYLYECQKKDFDAQEFYDPVTQGKTKVTAEGKKFWLSYEIKTEFRDNSPSALQIIRNYETAIQKVGGKTYAWTQIGGGELHGKYSKDAREVFVRVYINKKGNAYTLTIIEKENMKQEVVADAKFMAEGIHTTGHVAIYGIYFDFNKADVKPESDPALQEIVKLLQQDSKLKLYVVGHTDNVGGLDYNMKLSQQRAEAVVKELVSKYKIDGSRLKALGVGPAAPVTSNDTDDGKAQNRRVELVKQ